MFALNLIRLIWEKVLHKRLQHIFTKLSHPNCRLISSLTLLHSEQPKLHGVLAVLSAKGLR